MSFLLLYVIFKNFTPVIQVDLDLYFHLSHKFLENTPNYHPNSFNGPKERPDALETKWPLSGDVGRYSDAEDDNFTQPRQFWSRVIPFPDLF